MDLSKKLKADSMLDKYKFRLMAKKFKQKKNFGYFDSFSLVYTSMRLLIALDGVHNLTIH